MAAFPAVSLVDLRAKPNPRFKSVVVLCDEGRERKPPLARPIQGIE
jgi:hypothetical protein